MSSADRRRTLGKLVSVTSDNFVVELGSSADSFTLVGFDGQHYVARIGTYILIPLQSDYVVGEVVGLRERELAPSERSNSHIEDAHALGALKFLDIVPIGMLPFRKEGSFRFGVSIFPPLYSDALYTLVDDIDRILEVVDAIESIPIDPGQSQDQDSTINSRIKAFGIGTSVIFDGYDIKVRVDEFFGGHSAILGNTGSGKSCTVASILQSIFNKEDEYLARGASFVIFDTNGEYRQAFEALPAPISRLYAIVSETAGSNPALVARTNETTLDFRLPHWFMSSDEWELLLQASEKAQKPVLRTALGLTSLFAPTATSVLDEVKDHVLAAAILTILGGSDNHTAAVAKVRSLLSVYESPNITRTVVWPMLGIKYGLFLDDGEALRLLCSGLLRENITLPDYQNTPFRFDHLGEALDLAILHFESHGNRQIRDYCSSLITRFQAIRNRSEFSFMRVDPASLQAHEQNRERFVEKLLGVVPHTIDGVFLKESQLTILDMNEIEDEVVEIISTVVTRLIFERLRRAQKRNTFPVNLILEEAHRYIADRPAVFAIDATQIFERVAKEGRKYGLFLALASQRPSELSRTVLSQCSNYVVHRIQNPEDLSHIRQMTPFISESVLRRLPSLPKQHALIFGNSVNVPTTFRVRDANPKPKSDDAKIRETWFAPEGTLRGL